MSDIQQRLQLSMSRYNCSNVLQKQGVSQLGQRQLLQGDVLTNSQDRRALTRLLLLVGSLPQAATFKEFTITKKTDSSSVGMFG